MRITYDSGGSFSFDIVDFAPTIEPSYKLKFLSSTVINSLDRGEGADKYITQFTCKGSSDVYQDVYDRIKDLMHSSEGFSVDDFADNYFSDRVDHSSQIKATVVNLSEYQNSSLNIGTFTFELRATKPTLVSENSSVPDTFGSLQGGNTTLVEEGYTSNYSNAGTPYRLTHVRTTRKFKGSYVLTKDESILVQSWLRYTRGNSFNSTGAHFGREYLFGNDIADYFLANIISVSYTVISANKRQYEIELAYNGHY